MNLRTLLTVALALALATVAACGPEEPEGRVIKPISSQDAPAAGEQPAPAPAPGAPPGGGPAATGGGQLDYTIPEGWVPEPPINTMRLAQARVPGEAGDGEFALFYFGPGMGGGTEANIQRWLGQLQPEPGTEPERETYQQGGLTVHTVIGRGTLTPSPMTMQGGNPEPQPGSMLLGAVVEGPGGPWFFKVTGPAETLETYREEFFEMVRSSELR
jgi:hypothetical protein